MSYPFQNIFSVFTVFQKQRHLPAGITVDSIYLQTQVQKWLTMYKKKLLTCNLTASHDLQNNTSFGFSVDSVMLLSTYFTFNKWHSISKFLLVSILILMITATEDTTSDLFITLEKERKKMQLIFYYNNWIILDIYLCHCTWCPTHLTTQSPQEGDTSVRIPMQ